MDSLNSIAEFLTEAGRAILGLYNSPFFLVVKFILGIYAAIILADVVLLLIQRGLSGDIRSTLLGMNIPPELATRKNKLRKKWDKIRNLMADQKEHSYKIAIIQADDIIDDLIKRMGYMGENMGDRLAKINPGQIDNIEELKKAHEIKNRIVHEDDFKLTKEQAEEVIGYYENFLKYHEVLD
jgi:hypothetical protein